MTLVTETWPAQVFSTIGVKGQGQSDLFWFMTLICPFTQSFTASIVQTKLPIIKVKIQGQKAVVLVQGQGQSDLNLVSEMIEECNRGYKFE